MTDQEIEATLSDLEKPNEDVTSDPCDAADAIRALLERVEDLQAELSEARNDALEEAANKLIEILTIDTTGHKYNSEILDDRLDYLDQLPAAIRGLITKETK